MKLYRSIFILSTLAAIATALRSPTRLQPIAHGKPWSGADITINDERQLKLSGTTGWQAYPPSEEGAESLLVSQFLVTLDSNTIWSESDAPKWFVAIPSDIDDPEGTRDYIVIKGSFAKGVDTDPRTGVETPFQKQEVEYFQMVDPDF